MVKKTIETKEGFVIRYSRNDNKDFVWFVSHPKLRKEIGQHPVSRGDLEYFLNKCKKEITKLEKQNE